LGRVYSSSIIKAAFEQKLPKKVIVKLFNMRDEIQDEDPIAILQEAAKNYEPDPSVEQITCQFFESADCVPDPKDLNKELKNLMIFDDLQLEKQGKCESYTMLEVVTQILIAFIWHKATINYHDNQLERILTLSAYSLKMIGMLLIFIEIMQVQICH
jgi:hypothetical protein